MTQLTVGASVRSRNPAILPGGRLKGRSEGRHKAHSSPVFLLHRQPRVGQDWEWGDSRSQLRFLKQISILGLHAAST